MDKSYLLLYILLNISGLLLYGFFKNAFVAMLGFFLIVGGTEIIYRTLGFSIAAFYAISLPVALIVMFLAHQIRLRWGPLKNRKI